MARDWLATPNINKAAPRDWLQEPESQESFGASAAYAVPRIAEDLLRAGYNGAQNIPEYWNKAKTEIPGLLNPMNTIRHPIERGKQGLAGILELGQSINHAPHNIAQYGANRLHLIPQQWANNVPMAPSLDEEIENYIGQPKNPGDALLRGIGRNGDLLLGGNALLKSIPHLTKRGATKKLRAAQKKFSDLAEKEGNNLNNLLDINPELIEDARQYLPNNLAERNLINESHNAYDKLFKLQSDVGKISSARTGKIRSLFAPETHLKGIAGMQSRNKLLEAIHENLQKEGHHDISKLLREGQNDFRRYSEFKKYPRILGGAAAAYALPRNPLTDLIKNLWHAQ
jgi:hypothetical protein